MENTEFCYGDNLLRVSDALNIAKGRLKGVLSKSCIDRVQRSADVVDKIVLSKEIVYGVNTGFGPLCTTLIDAEDTRLLQENILKSHAVGVGEPIDPLLSKLMLILKVHALAKGFSGIRRSTLERIVYFINQEILPIVPKQGSVGASGDLAPLSHLFLPLIGLGKVHYKDSVRDTVEVLKELNIEPLQLSAKEGLALINGTQFIAAHAVLAVDRMHKLLLSADVIGAMMIEGLAGSVKPFYKELHELRPYSGNKLVADTIFMLLQDSEIVESHKNCRRVQDPYSLRCMPQVHGASRNAWLHFKESVEIEINSVTDNPILINERLTISGGNFHGQPLALPIDYACLAVSEIGNISDRRIYLSLEGEVENVPKLLMKSTGLNSGFMILQYTTAALASENKGKCFPSSADSIPTSLGQEDHVSMGSIGGRKLLEVIENCERILGIELICAAQAVDFHRPLKMSFVLEEAHAAVRRDIPHFEKDELFSDYLEKGYELVRNGDIAYTLMDSMDGRFMDILDY